MNELDCSDNIEPIVDWLIVFNLAAEAADR